MNNIVISNSNEKYVVVNESSNIKINSNLNVSLLINSSDLKIDLNILENTNVNILIINGLNNVYNINNNGELHIKEITLDNSDSKLEVNLLKENSSINLDTLSLASLNNIKYNQVVNHNAKYTISNISNYGIAIKKSDILFDTIGKIEKGMSKSNCRQLSHGVIMDDDSKITSNPILLIDEYDVVANHGAAIGKMSDDVLFYLRSRGLNKNEAFLLYLDGIINPFLANINDDSIKEDVLKKINNLIVR